MAAPMQEREDSQSMDAKMANLGRMTPMLLMVLSSVRYVPPCSCTPRFREALDLANTLNPRSLQSKGPKGSFFIC